MKNAFIGMEAMEDDTILFMLKLTKNQHVFAHHPDVAVECRIYNYGGVSLTEK